MNFRLDVFVHVANETQLEKSIEALGVNLATLITNQGTKIMSIISEFVVKQTAFNIRTGAAIDGIVGDIKGLNDKITALSTSPEDQALLADVVAAGEALATKAEALDAMTPPAVPAEPGTVNPLP